MSSDDGRGICCDGDCGRCGLDYRDCDGSAGGSCLSSKSSDCGISGGRSWTDRLSSTGCGQVVFAAVRTGHCHLGRIRGNHSQGRRSARRDRSGIRGNGDDRHRVRTTECSEETASSEHREKTNGEAGKQEPEDRSRHARLSQGVLLRIAEDTHSSEKFHGQMDSDRTVTAQRTWLPTGESGRSCLVAQTPAPIQAARPGHRSTPLGHTSRLMMCCPCMDARQSLESNAIIGFRAVLAYLFSRAENGKSGRSGGMLCSKSQGRSVPFGGHPANGSAKRATAA